jgi:DNA-directed RNA polymerase specialized sigma54-like protein
LLGFFRYVDDILIISDSNLSDLHDILDDFNKIHPKPVFTAEQETDHKLNFLDITIHRTPNNWKFDIYRKPTFTDTIIHTIRTIPTSTSTPPPDFYTTD